MKTEVLIVNDGSKDRSLEIAREYESHYPVVFRVIDKPNGNYGSCVNRGLKEASGKYIKVLDADDAFYNDDYSVFVSSLAGIDVDMVLTNYNRVDADYKVLHTTCYNLPSNRTLSLSDVDSNRGIEMHGITYKTSLLKEHNYNQSEGISYTDAEWSTIPLSYVKKIQYLPLCLYRYLIGREGQTITPQNRVKNLWMMHKVFCRLENFYNSNIQFLGESQYIIYMKLYNMATYIYKIAIYSNDVEALKLLMKFDEYLKTNNNKLYTELNDVKLYKYLPVRFINKYRMAPNKYHYYWRVYTVIMYIRTFYSSIRSKIAIL